MQHKTVFKLSKLAQYKYIKYLRTFLLKLDLFITNTTVVKNK